MSFAVHDRLGIDYADESKILYGRAKRCVPFMKTRTMFFVCRTVETRKVPASSMPMLYLFLGNDLGFRFICQRRTAHVHSVEQPGYRMNIETTIVKQVAMTPDRTIS